MRYVRGFRKLADARGEEPGIRPVVKKNACGIWVKNALYARGEEFLPEAGMEERGFISPGDEARCRERGIGNQAAEADSAGERFL